MMRTVQLVILVVCILAHPVLAKGTAKLTPGQKRMVETVDKMKKTRIPEVNFRLANVRDVVDTLGELSRDADTSKGRSGVNLVLIVPPSRVETTAKKKTKSKDPFDDDPFKDDGEKAASNKAPSPRIASVIKLRLLPAM